MKKYIFSVICLILLLLLILAPKDMSGQLDSFHVNGEVMTKKELEVLKAVDFEETNFELTDEFLGEIGLVRTKPQAPRQYISWFPQYVTARIGKIGDEEVTMVSIPYIQYIYLDHVTSRSSRVEALFRVLEYVEYEDRWASVDADIRYEDVTLSIVAGDKSYLYTGQAYGQLHNKWGKEISSNIYPVSYYERTFFTGSVTPSTLASTVGRASLADEYMTASIYSNGEYQGDHLGFVCSISSEGGADAEDIDTLGAITVSYTRNNKMQKEKREYHCEVLFNYYVDFDS